MKPVNRLFITMLILVSLVLTPFTFAFWAQELSPNDSNSNINIPIGDFEFGDNVYESYDKDKVYDNGDKFVHNGIIWEIKNSGQIKGKDIFDEYGNIKSEFLYSYGPLNEDTDEWRSYNTYRYGNIVKHNYEGVLYNWFVNNEGANHVEPGTQSGEWTRLGEEYFKFNIYPSGSIAHYNGNRYKALNYNVGILPSNSSRWELLGPI